MILRYTSAHRLLCKLSTALLSCLLALPSLADPYALLRGNPTGYAQVIPGRALDFPRDHLPHPDFRIEWWYLTANLETDTGAQYGIHWTLFRQSLSPDDAKQGWSSNQVWMAHAALSTPQGHVYEERFARGGIGQAGVELNEAGNFTAWLDDWQLSAKGAEPLPATLRFRLEDHSVSLTLTASSPWVLQGERGYSQKSNQGQASYYYSQPHIRVVGEIIDNTIPMQVTGKAWLDREWSSQPLAPNQPGWDWLSAHMDDGHALMVYRLRQQDGAHWISGTWISPDGSSTHLTADDIRFEPGSATTVTSASGETRQLPLDWTLSLPGKNLSWTVKPVSTDNWLDTTFPYWEGPVTLHGQRAGQGYMELTGY